MTLADQIRNNIARHNLFDFAGLNCDFFEPTAFHKQYYAILNAFAKGEIRKLIVSIPPQHGKSLGSSQLLPAFMLGRNPDLNIAIASYSFNLARKFNQRVQRVIDSDIYPLIFSGTKLKGMQSGSDSYTRTTEEFDIVGHNGSLRAVGREGSLTGNRVDVMIIDDLYKDAMEANSPLIRENAWEWYTSVVKTRLHNDSQELIVFTRWHEDDLVGKLERLENVVEVKSIADIDNISPNSWVKVNFQAIKESEPTEIDPRQYGEALWSDRHNVQNLEGKRLLDPVGFQSLYQGDPTPTEGLLYHGFKTYEITPITQVKARKAYVDPADSGSDYLCAIVYDETEIGNFVIDVLYTQKDQAFTESAVTELLNRHGVALAHVEENNGGKSFARTIARNLRTIGNSYTAINIFHQHKNKEARILTYAPDVVNTTYMPAGWERLFTQFYRDVTSFRRIGKNPHDDAPDTLTGMIEMRLKSTGPIKVKSFNYGNQ